MGRAELVVVEVTAGVEVEAVAMVGVVVAVAMGEGR